MVATILELDKRYFSQYYSFQGSSFYPEERGSMILQNVSTYVPNYMTSHLKNRVYNHCHDHLRSLAQTDTAKL